MKSLVVVYSRTGNFSETEDQLSNYFASTVPKIIP